MTRKSFCRGLLALGVAGATILTNGAAMSEEREEMDMRLRRVMKDETINSTIALKVSDMVIRHRYRLPDSYDLELTVNGQGDRWEIRSKIIYPAIDFDNAQYGQVIVLVIVKSNCQILRFDATAVTINP
jgi:hypothetical protein